MWPPHNQARQPLATICVRPCSTIAAATGISANKIPNRIMPPAMPKMPETNDVASTAAANVTAIPRLSMGAHHRGARRAAPPHHDMAVADLALALAREHV